MRLEGKCLEDFEKWYILHRQHQRIEGESNSYDHITIFKLSPDSMKWGVIQDFAAHKGIHIGIGRWVEYPNNVMYWLSLSDEKNESLISDWDSMHLKFAKYKTRPEAREEAVKQFVIEYNK